MCGGTCTVGAAQVHGHLARLQRRDSRTVRVAVSSIAETAV